MANDSKKQTAKDRFAKAKQDADDAVLASQASEPQSDDPVTPKTANTDASLNDDTVTSAEATTPADGAAPDDVSIDTLSGGEGVDTLDGGDDSLAGDSLTETPAAEDAVEDAIVSAEPASEPEESGGDEEIDHVDDGPGFAATALKYLVILLIGMGIALWAGPRAAPYLPASIAAWVAPNGATNAEAEARLTELVAEKTASATKTAAEAQASAEAAAAGVAALAARLDDGLAAVREDLSADIGAAGQTRGAAADRIETVAERLTAAEASLSGLRTEIDSLSGFASDGASPGAATLERVAAFGAAVEGLRAEVAALSARASQIEAAAQASDVEALETRVTALEGGEAATANARSEAEEIVRSANTDAALAGLSHSLSAGRSFSDSLDELSHLTGATAPEALSSLAATGAPSLAHLTQSFPDAAQAAYAADLKSLAGDGIFDSVLANLQGRIGGRPSVETPGDDAGAVLSRIKARLSEGALDAAQGEAQSLSASAQAAMASWLGQLNQTVAARSGLADLRATLNTK